jgi:hypothetical protein
MEGETENGDKRRVEFCVLQVTRFLQVRGLESTKRGPAANRVEPNRERSHGGEIKTYRNNRMAALRGTPKMANLEGKPK